jgi:hypothetical protein
MIPVDPHTALEGGVAALDLLDSIIKLVHEAKKDGGKMNVADLVKRLPSEAFSLAGTFIKQVEKLQFSFKEAGVNLDLPIEKLRAETSYWSRRQYKLIRAFSPVVDAICDQLTALVDDVVAVSHCCEREDILAKSFAGAIARKSELRAAVDKGKSVREVFETLLKFAYVMRAELGDLKN